MKLLHGFCMMVLLMGMANLSFADDVSKPLTPLTGKDLEMAQEMNQMYARHMYSSTCVERQRDLFLPKGLSPDESAKRIKGFRTSCDCMADMMIKEGGTANVIDYVTGRYGNTVQPMKTDRLGNVEDTETPVIKKIRKMSFDKDTRRKCGFSQ